jgi:hypothetical protein
MIGKSANTKIFASKFSAGVALSEKANFAHSTATDQAERFEISERAKDLRKGRGKEKWRMIGRGKDK